MNWIEKSIKKIIHVLLICYAGALCVPSYAVLCLDGNGHVTIEDIHDSCHQDCAESDCCQDLDQCHDCHEESSLDEGHHHHTCNDIILNDTNLAFLNKMDFSLEGSLIHLTTLPAKRFYSNNDSDLFQFKSQINPLFIQHRTTVLII